MHRLVRVVATKPSHHVVAGRTELLADIPLRELSRSTGVSFSSFLPLGPVEPAVLWLLVGLVVRRLRVVEVARLVGMLAAWTLSLVLAQPEPWVLEGRGPGSLRWYTRARAGSEVRELRATSLFRLPPESVWSVLTEYERYPSSMPGTVEARVLRVSDAGTDVYLRYELPLISPRDTVVQMRAAVDAERGVWQLSWASTSDSSAPALRADTVRLAKNIGFWRLSVREGGLSTFVEYELFSPPGGGVPPFIVNSVKGRGVRETFAALERAASQRPAERQ